MNFLQLAQRVAQESGTVDGSAQLSSVVGQIGRLKSIVDWTADAWVQIQSERNAWRWMRREFSGKQTTAGTARYTAASWAITDWGNWITDRDCTLYRPFSIYKQSAGLADEGEILEIAWEEWRSKYRRGVQNQNRPTEYAISPQGEVCFGPIPDATYVVRGEYRKAPQVLSANDDVPDLPAQFHMVIVWRAILLLVQHDEADPGVQVSAKFQHDKLMSDLTRDQLLRHNLRLGGGPLA
jgi:hypothetical protein